jgi:hypothetical protein
MQRRGYLREKPYVVGVIVRLRSIRETVYAPNVVIRMHHVSSWEHTLWLLREIGNGTLLVDEAKGYISTQFYMCIGNFRFTHRFSSCDACFRPLTYASVVKFNVRTLTFEHISYRSGGASGSYFEAMS